MIFCPPSSLLWMEGRKEIVEERWKNACQESAGERELRLLLMQRVAEKERKQEQAHRKVAGVFGAFCKYHLSYQLGI